MTTMTIVLLAVVAMAAVAKFGNRGDNGLFPSSTSMFFGNGSVNAGTTC